MVTVSVILPNYNHSKYLRLRIDTILAQTYPDFELIILDDCSVDSSREIIESYQGHPRISKVIFNEKNSGSTFLQWEKGIQLAVGKYIWLAESDDYSDPHFLERLMSAIENNQGVGLAFCASNITDENNQVSRKNYDYSPGVNDLLSHDHIFDGQMFCEEHLFFGCILVNASAVVFEKSLYLNINQDFKSYKVSGDWRMWVEICYNTRVAYVSESLNYFRFHTNNVRTNKANIMNGEAIRNYLASLRKTGSDKVKGQLKKRLVKHWCFEFSRDIRNFRFTQSAFFMKEILKEDTFFIFRVGRYLFGKTLGIK